MGLYRRPEGLILIFEIFISKINWLDNEVIMSFWIHQIC